MYIFSKVFFVQNCSYSTVKINIPGIFRSHLTAGQNLAVPYSRIYFQKFEYYYTTQVASSCKHHHHQQQFYSHFFAFQNFQIFKRIQATYCKVSNTPNTDCLARYNPANSATTVNFTQFIDDGVLRTLQEVFCRHSLFVLRILFNFVFVASLVLLLQSILRQISSSSSLNLSSTLSMSSLS